MAAIFVDASAPVMAAPPPQSTPSEKEAWTIEGAESLLQSLMGVVSARVVAKPGGEIQEIHLLTTDQVTPKQTVRNVESALMAHFDVSIDHRKISVAQSKEPPAQARATAVLQVEAPKPTTAVVQAAPAPAAPVTAIAGREARILFVGHQVEMERSHRIRIKVTVEWRGRQHEGEAVGADLPRARFDAVANATLRALEAAIAAGRPDGPLEFTLALDGVKMIDAFERQYVLAAVHAISGRAVTALAGAAAAEENLDRSVILATLQATDRWVRGRA